jgi:molecular chaperone HtpG
MVPKAQPITDDILVGKDILELLAAAMYADPLTIYREYLQNAADAIDEAREEAMHFGEEPGVHITVDRMLRSVKIRDNGTGIPAGQMVRRLTAIGASTKRGKQMRGFRGVGRLSGLGYCQELLFRSRVEGESKVTELSWDGRKLRELLRDGTYAGTLSELIRDVVMIKKLPADEFPTRFFEVELRRVTRLRGDMLLNEESIRGYLAQVAPVPFHPDFTLGPSIASFLSERGVRSPIQIRIIGEDEPIYHRARNSITHGSTLETVEGVEFLVLLGQDGEVDAFGWMLEHSYAGAVPKRLGLGGIRLRTGNIQVGGEGILSPLFPEPRFAAWAIGDLHVVSTKILPNGRRDDFEASVAYSYLQDELSLLAKRITQTIRDKSDRRVRTRKVNSATAVVTQWLEQAAHERLPEPIAKRVRAIVDDRLLLATKELTKASNRGHDSHLLETTITSLTKRARKLLGKETAIGPGRRSARDKAIEIALEVILEHAATPHAGLVMSRRVLNAFEAS